MQAKKKEALRAHTKTVTALWRLSSTTISSSALDGLVIIWQISVTPALSSASSSECDFEMSCA